MELNGSLLYFSTVLPPPKVCVSSVVFSDFSAETSRKTRKWKENHGTQRFIVVL